MAMQLFLLVYKWIAARPYRRTNQRRVPTIIFFSSVACTIQVSMQTTGFLIRLLKCIDILVCSGPEEKKIRIYRRIMFHRTTLFRLYARDGAASVEHCDRFCKHIARSHPMYGHLV